MRGSLKAMIQNEIEKSPETLEALELKESINIVCKLMPYVFLKVETIYTTESEPFLLD